MRFSGQGELTASDIVNTWPEHDLAHIFKTYGEERHAARVAQLIIAARASAPIQTVSDLVDVVMRGVGKRGRVHPATRIFQALRITTNREVENLENALPDMIDVREQGAPARNAAQSDLQAEVDRNNTLATEHRATVSALSWKRCSAVVGTSTARPSAALTNWRLHG